MNSQQAQRNWLYCNIKLDLNAGYWYTIVYCKVCTYVDILVYEINDCCSQTGGGNGLLIIILQNIFPWLFMLTF